MSNIENIKSYMIRLGVDVDDISITKWDGTLKKLDSSFKSISGNLEKSDQKIHNSIANRFSTLVKTTAKVAGVFATASIGISKFMHSIADSDMEMQKFARRLYISTDQAKALNNTLGAMDLSLGDLQDVAYNPELLKQYKEFLGLAKSFRAPEGMKQSFKDIRLIFSEFQKFNLTFNYFRERVVHFIYNTIRVPAQKFKNFLQLFNTKFAVNINKWAERLGTLLGMVLRMGLRIAEAFKNVGAFVLRLWNRLSDFNKRLIGGFIFLNTVLKASPIWKLFTLLSGLTLLYDDYKTFSEGGVSSEKLKPIWNFITEQRDNPDSFFNKLLDAINKLIDFINDLGKLIQEIWNKIKESKLGKKLGLSEEDNKPSHIPQKSSPTFTQRVLNYGEKNGWWKLKGSDSNRLINTLGKYQTPINNGFGQTLVPSPGSNSSMTPMPVEQNFYFNVESSSLKDPQTFFNDVSTLIRNHKGTLVGAN